MEDHSRLKINLTLQQPRGSSETVTTRARQRPTVSSDDLYYKSRKNTKDNSPKRSANFPNLNSKAVEEEEELVKYMSHLPSYLQRGETRQEKVLNVGVLDWGRLEKWQCSQKQTFHWGRRHSISNGNSPSTISMEDSSGRGQSSSLAHKKLRRPSLQCHLLGGGHAQDAKLYEERIKKFQNLKFVETDTTLKYEQGKFIRTDRQFPDNHPEIKLDQCKRNDSVLKINSESRASNGLNVSPCAVSSGVPHSCPLPCEIEGRTETKRFSADAESVSIFHDSSHSVPRPVKLRVPLGDRISEVKRSAKEAMSSTSKEPSISKAADEKPRSTSPFRRLSINMGKISKSFVAKEGSSIPPQSNMAQNSSKTTFENTVADAQNATSRARSSPLRRLLDPLLKPKAPNSRHPGDPLQRHSVSADRLCRPSNRQSDSSTEAQQPGTARFDMGSCREIRVDDSTQGKKHGSSSYQALLRVAAKNGQPLFTFAVDNERNILAATMKKLSSSREDDDYSCIYTFFSIQEIRKKNGRWINQGGKSKDHDYIPNVVAQLKVSGSQFSHRMRENSMELSFAREFVLFAVDLQQAEQQQTLECQPNDELAAIVVKIPKIINRSATGNGQKAREQPINATVILPSGIHSLPNKGGPSSLIHRWRSGGACDCGGWDLGCELRIFANQSQLVKRPRSSVACSMSDKFELISQGGVKESQPVFSLSPFKDGIYSVEFTSSVSILQAFSLCIAFLDSQKLCEVLDSGNLSKGKTSLETMLSQNDGTRTRNGNDGEVPAARYVSYPPHSPVGRV